MEQFILGVIASTLASLLIYITRNLWVKCWFYLFIKIYPNVSGKYEVISLSGPEYTEIFPDATSLIEIVQFGKKLSGKAAVLSGRNEKQKFKLSGFITASADIVLNYEAFDASVKGIGSYVMSVQGADRELIGHVAFICSNCNKVHEYPVKFNKIES